MGSNRVVTAHDEAGTSIVLINGEIKQADSEGLLATQSLVWSTPALPPDNNSDLAQDASMMGFPVDEGSAFWVFDLKPGMVSPMHRTHSLDYGVVMSGEVEMLLDGGEAVTLRAGDLVVQRGTNHQWRVKGDEVVRMIFVCLEAGPVIINGEATPATF